MFEKLQTELGEGPCLEAFKTGEPVSIPDLADDLLFPVFAARAQEVGLVAVFTFPLRHGDATTRRTGPVPERRWSVGHEATEAAQTLADVVASYLLNARTRESSSWPPSGAATSLHDALTGLPNRFLLAERLEHAILNCRRTQQKVAILFADIDHFKLINDSHGHHVGDELLVAIAQRLTGLLRRATRWPGWEVTSSSSCARTSTTRRRSP